MGLPPGQWVCGLGGPFPSLLLLPVWGSLQPPWIARDPWSTLTSPRSVLFNPDGCCLYSGCQDSLRVYGWEPERCFDVVLVSWGKVADLAVCNDQLVRALLPVPPPPAPMSPPKPCWGPACVCPSSAASCR